MVARTCLSVTLYVHCMSCLYLNENAARGQTRGDKLHNVANSAAYWKMDVSYESFIVQNFYAFYISICY